MWKLKPKLPISTASYVLFSSVMSVHTAIKVSFVCDVVIAFNLIFVGRGIAPSPDPTAFIFIYFLFIIAVFKKVVPTSCATARVVARV